MKIKKYINLLEANLKPKIKNLQNQLNNQIAKQTNKANKPKTAEYKKEKTIKLQKPGSPRPIAGEPDRPDWYKITLTTTKPKEIDEILKKHKPGSLAWGYAPLNPNLEKKQIDNLIMNSAKNSTTLHNLTHHYQLTPDQQQQIDQK